MHEISLLNVVREQGVAIVAVRHHRSWPQGKVVYAKLLQMREGHASSRLVVPLTSRMGEDDSITFRNKRQGVIMLSKKISSCFHV